jgi:hypothetical protein
MTAMIHCPQVAEAECTTLATRRIFQCTSRRRQRSTPVSEASRSPGAGQLRALYHPHDVKKCFYHTRTMVMSGRRKTTGGNRIAIETRSTGKSLKQITRRRGKREIQWRAVRPSGGRLVACFTTCLEGRAVAGARCLRNVSGFISAQTDCRGRIT